MYMQTIHDRKNVDRTPTKSKKPVILITGLGLIKIRKVEGKGNSIFRTTFAQKMRVHSHACDSVAQSRKDLLSCQKASYLLSTFSHQSEYDEDENLWLATPPLGIELEPWGRMATHATAALSQAAFDTHHDLRSIIIYYRA